MQGKIARWSVGSLRHTVRTVGLCRISPLGCIPKLIKGFEVSPANFPFIHHRTVGFVSSLPWGYAGILPPGSSIFCL
jgi:hypothetical protein